MSAPSGARSAGPAAPGGPSGNRPRQWSIPVRPSGPLPSARGPGGSRSARAVSVTRVHRAPAGGASGAAVVLHQLGKLAATSNPQLPERERPGRRRAQPSRPARLSRPWAAWPPTGLWRRTGPILLQIDFVPQLSQKRFHPGGLDRPKRDAVDTRRPLVAHTILDRSGPLIFEKPIYTEWPKS